MSPFVIARLVDQATAEAVGVEERPQADAGPGQQQRHHRAGDGDGVLPGGGLRLLDLRGATQHADRDAPYMQAEPAGDEAVAELVQQHRHAEQQRE